jgi:drug/metabolite transporter (DMT)-like permease
MNTSPPILFNRIYLLAAACMIGSSAMFSLMNVFVRMGAESMHTMLIVNWRNMLAFAILLPFALFHGRNYFKTKRLKGHIWRALIGLSGMQLWTYSISIMPLNIATALSFTAPLIACLFAILVFREPSDRYRWAALFTGFGGMLIIIQPGMADFNDKSLIVLFTTSMWAATGLMVKSLTRTEPAFRIVVLMTFFMTIFSLPMAIIADVWRWPNVIELKYLLAIAISSLGAHFLQVKAYSLASIVSLMPFDFTRLIFTSILSYFMFAQTLDGNTLIGGLVITISAFAIASRDARMRAPSSIPRA